MNKRIKAGSDIHAGDGGYGIGTKENYDAFVKVRNKSLAAARIRRLAEQAGINMDSFQFSGTPIKHIVDEPSLEKFAVLIVRECVKFCEHESNDDEHDEYDMGMWVKAESIKTAIMEEFGIKE